MASSSSSSTSEENTNGPICPAHLFQDSKKYNMNHKHRGKALIFVHTDYDPSLCLNRRNGSEYDVDLLENSFTSLGFKVERHADLNINEIKNVLNEVSREDHTNRDCLAVIVLTHGLEGILFAYDGSYPQDKLWSPFTADKCSTLIGKPKLFFIQACRGLSYDRGFPHEKDFQSKVFCSQLNDNVDHGPSLFEVETDFLVAFATVHGYVSWKKGGQRSWFIQKLCEELEKNSGEHLLNMLVVIQQRVAVDFFSRTKKGEESHHCKQIPCVTHRLKKLLYF